MFSKVSSLTSVFSIQLAFPLTAIDTVPSAGKEKCDGHTTGLNEREQDLVEAPRSFEMLASSLVGCL